MFCLNFYIPSFFFGRSSRPHLKFTKSKLLNVIKAFDGQLEELRKGKKTLKDKDEIKELTDRIKKKYTVKEESS